MDTDEHADRQLRARLEEPIGTDATAGSADRFSSSDGDLVRRHHDGGAPRDDLHIGLAELHAELSELREDLRQQLAQQTHQLRIWILGCMATLAALAFVAGRLR